MKKKPYKVLHYFFFVYFSFVWVSSVFALDFEVNLGVRDNDWRLHGPGYTHEQITTDSSKTTIRSEFYGGDPVTTELVFGFTIQVLEKMRVGIHLGLNIPLKPFQDYHEVLPGDSLVKIGQTIVSRKLLGPEERELVDTYKQWSYPIFASFSYLAFSRVELTTRIGFESYFVHHLELVTWREPGSVRVLRSDEINENETFILPSVGLSLDIRFLKKSWPLYITIDARYQPMYTSILNRSASTFRTGTVGAGPNQVIGIRYRFAERKQD